MLASFTLEKKAAVSTGSSLVPHTQKHGGRRKNTTIDVLLFRCALSILAGRSSVLRAGLGCRVNGNGVTGDAGPGMECGRAGAVLGT